MEGCDNAVGACAARFSCPLINGPIYLAIEAVWGGSRRCCCLYLQAYYRFNASCGAGEAPQAQPPLVLLIGRRAEGCCHALVLLCE